MMESCSSEKLRMMAEKTRAASEPEPEALTDQSGVYLS